MKGPWRSLKRGDVIEAKVTELLPDQFLIANWQGSLLRVKNESAESYRVGQLLQLMVESVAPLVFKIPVRRNLSLNRFV